MTPNSAIVSRYKRERVQGETAKNAWLQAKWTERPEHAIAEDLCERSESRGRDADEVLSDGLTVRVRVGHDDLTPEDAGYGTFTSDEGKLSHGDGAIKFQHKSRDEHHIYVPSFGLAERIDAYHQAGWHRGPARLQAMRDIREECKHAREWNGGSYISVVVSIEGVAIVENDCGGFSPDGGIEFVMEAISEARRAVASGLAAQMIKDEAKRAQRDGDERAKTLARLSRRLATKARTAKRKGA